MPAIFKHNNFFTVKEIERLLELGHTPQDFLFLLSNGKQEEP